MPVTGPDLSHYQGAVNFPAVRRAGHALVVLKATDGTSTQYLDPTFPGNRDAARAAGLIVGAYHFARATDPIAEAEWFCRITDPLATGDFVVLDWEVNGPDPVGWCLAWLDHVAAKCNVRPLLYINQSVRDAFDWSPVANAGHGLWLAKYDGNLTRPAGGAWGQPLMKQYTDAAQVPGVQGPCDCNVFFGTTADLAAIGHNPTPEADLTPAESATLDAIYAVLMRKQNGGVQDVYNGVNATLAAVRALADPAAIAAAVVAALPTSSGSGLTEADVESALRKVLGSLDNPPA